ncbi:MAG: NAD-dependent deacetylase [Actinomycetota bacterium]|nr:NAD-dependent deacetylase [Actinomycetota bacterium]
MSRNDQPDLATIAGWIRDSRYVMALTGAGISTESGIPDFRGPDGVWTRDPKAERLSHIDAYLADPSVRIESWQRRMAHPAWTASPNSGHIALADLERRGRLQSLVTQNIDGLHALAGTSPDILVEIHGTMRDVACLSCGERGPAQATFRRVRAGEEDPPCLSCGGILKSATISFGQALVPEDLERAQLAAATCDVFLAIGSTLKVYPVAYLPQIAVESGARLVILNAQATPFDPYADAVLRQPIGEALPRLVGMV